MWRSTRYFALVVLVTLLQLLLLWQLLSPWFEILEHSLIWLGLHALSAAAFGWVTGNWIASFTNIEAKPTSWFLGIMTLCMPGVGGISSLIALIVAYRVWKNRDAESTDFVITENTDLPFTTPSGRKASVPDSRGFVEQLRYSKDSDALYQKVLSSSYIRNSISVDVLREAVKHSDERIRLTAYQILDRKVNALNAEIQRLEAVAQKGSQSARSTTWLQIANNYWELLTLERGDEVARKQLLKKAISSAKQSVNEDRTNRNAFLVLGRVSLAAGELNAADVAFQKAMALGMPADKVVPYLAEVAFGKRDFRKVQQLLDSLDDAFKKYPPLRQVVEYWT